MFSQVFHLSFFCMLQLLYLNISKVNRVLHMRCVWEATGGTNDVWGSVGDVRDGTEPLLVRFLASPTRSRSFAPNAGQRSDTGTWSDFR
jgi:hypothetical protein